MVLGMRYDSSFNYAMAGLYRTAVAVSALIILLSVSSVHAADPPVPRGNVSVSVNPTTGYYTSTNSTLRLPNGVSASPTSGALPVVTKYSGGLQQTLPSGITIDAIKKTAPLDVAVRAKTPALKTAAKGLFRGNLAGLVLGAGLDTLLDGIGALIDEGGTVSKVSPPPVDPAAPHFYVQISPVAYGYTPQQACSDTLGKAYSGYYMVNITSSRLSNGMCYISGAQASGAIVGPVPLYVLGANNSNPCPPGSSKLSNGYCDVASVPVPLTPTQLDDAIDSSYVPDPTDWKNLVPHLTPDDIEITWAPSLQGEPRTTTVYDAEGNPHKVTETNIWYDFDIRDNPSPRPALDMKTREETKTYEDGVLTSTTTTNSTASAGSSGTPPPPPESPIDCDLFPTACAWFDWTQEEPVEPDTDLSGLLQEVPIVSETFTITGGVAACPAPMVLDLSVFGSREVSYQPLCDLASTMKYLYLALMSFAAAVLLNRSVNRV